MNRTAHRVAAAAAAALAVATAGSSYADSGTAAGPTPSITYSPVGSWQLLALVNARRHALGLPALKVDPRLAAIARRHVEQMAAANDLHHNDALFTPTSHRELGMSMLGENVGWNYSVPAQNAAYLASAGHRANMQQVRFRLAGVAVVKDDRGRIWSTEDFGAPAAH